MSTGSFPLNIAGQLFSNSTLGGKGYVRAFPDLLRAVTLHRKLNSAFVSRTRLNSRWYPRPTLYSFQVEAGKLWAPGTFLYGQGENEYGVSNDSKVWGTVSSYNYLTGALVFEVTGYEGSFDIGTLYLTSGAQFDLPTDTSPLGFSEGGTGASTVAAALAALDIGEPVTQLSEVFDDFMSHLNSNSGVVPYPWIVQRQVGTGVFSNWPGAAPGQPTNALDWVARSGFLQLQVTDSADSVGLTRGVGGCHMAGGALVFETAVYIPTVSDGTNTFKVYIGLRGQASSDSDPFSYSGVGFTYTHGENSGNWTIRHGTGGSMTSVNSGIAVSAGTWYRLALTWNGTNCVPSINGSALSAISAASLPQSGSSNTLAPSIALTKTLGSATRRAVVDYVFLQKKVSR